MVVGVRTLDIRAGQGAIIWLGVRTRQSRECELKRI